jgi:LPPG:FO 2-phospho-L-lactate transferase
VPDVKVAALAGGVGAARFLRGLVEVVDPASVTAVVNTGDDETFHSLHVSPDVDSVVYTLAGASNPETGWGLAGESFRCMDALDRFGAPTWFRLGDLDLATHLYRTTRLANGAPLSVVTAEIAAAWGLALTVLPMTDDPAPTMVVVRGEERPVPMQEWFVGMRGEPPVDAVDLRAAATASPGPGVLDALRDAEVVVVCPSNPFLSVGPILEVPGVGEALAGRRDTVVAVSPIVGGRAVKGPAASMMADLGHEVSPAGVARLYHDVCGTFVLDEVDAALAGDVAAVGLRPVVAPTLMRDVAAAAALAGTVLAAAAGAVS